MIDKLAAHTIARHSPACSGHNLAITLGDQIPIIGEKVFARLRESPELENCRDLLMAEKPYSLTEFFAACGFTEAKDIDYNNKAAINLDLGKPLPAHYHQTADFVYDGGVIEHIPDIYQALKNSASLVKKGGVIFHVNPTACYSGSYYSLNPELFHDFFTQNGFRTLDLFVFWRIRKALLPKFNPARIFHSFERKRLRKKGNSTWYYAKNCDRLADLRIHRQPQDKAFIGKMNWRGMPPYMHTAYIGVREEIKEFKAPVPEYYPAIG